MASLSIILTRSFPLIWSKEPNLCSRKHTVMYRFKKNPCSKTLQNMVKDDVLEPCGRSHWAVPTFVVPKKDDIVQWVSDFKELNKLIKRNHPLFQRFKIL